jgi:hypothetical protein
VAQFIVASTEPLSQLCALEPTHWLLATFDARMILLQSFAEVSALAVFQLSHGVVRIAR